MPDSKLPTVLKSLKSANPLLVAGVFLVVGILVIGLFLNNRENDE